MRGDAHNLSSGCGSGRGQAARRSNGRRQRHARPHPCCLSSMAATAESTPPEIPTATSFRRPASGATAAGGLQLPASRPEPPPAALLSVRQAASRPQGPAASRPQGQAASRPQGPAGCAAAAASGAMQRASMGEAARAARASRPTAGMWFSRPLGEPRRCLRLRLAEPLGVRLHRWPRVQEQRAVGKSPGAVSQRRRCPFAAPACGRGTRGTLERRLGRGVPAGARGTQRPQCGLSS